MDISLDQARRQAKELLRAARDGDAEALARMRTDRDALRLADAQRAVAADLGFDSWPKLVRHVEVTQGDVATRRERFLRLVFDGRADRAEAILANDPGVAEDSLAVALTTGDVAAVTAALDADAAVLDADVESTGKRPLLCATHSAYLQPASPRADDVLEVVELLLDRGADPNQTFTNEFGDMGALYGAAGVAHNPQATRLLLDRGADPDDGESVYHAVQSQDTTCLAMLLAHGATVRDTNGLGHAIARHDDAMLRLLLEDGDLTPADRELRTSLLHAGTVTQMRLLLEHGADVAARDKDGLTAYDHAVRGANAEQTALLADAGGAVEPDANCAWIGAVLAGQPHASEPPQPLRHSDTELLAIRASQDDATAVARLLDAGVPIDAPGLEGQPIHYTGFWAGATTMALLLERGADPEAEGQYGTPLGYVAWASHNLDPQRERADGYAACADLLLARGAKVHERMPEIASDEIAAMLEPLVS